MGSKWKPKRPGETIEQLDPAALICGRIRIARSIRLESQGNQLYRPGASYQRAMVAGDSIGGLFGAPGIGERVGDST